jgi:hypothetical protein
VYIGPGIALPYPVVDSRLVIRVVRDFLDFLFTCGTFCTFVSLLSSPIQFETPRSLSFLGIDHVVHDPSHSLLCFYIFSADLLEVSHTNLPRILILTCYFIAAWKTDRAVFFSFTTTQLVNPL